jgi:hypothetical protein
VPSAGIVPSFDELGDGRLRLGLVQEAAAVDRLAFERGEEALAHGVVVGIADRTHGRADASQRRPKAMEVYCEPWSEWWMTLSGRRRYKAMSSASSTNSAFRCIAIAQPTIRRLKTSRTTAR